MQSSHQKEIVQKSLVVVGLEGLQPKKRNAEGWVAVVYIATHSMKSYQNWQNASLYAPTAIEYALKNVQVG